MTVKVWIGQQFEYSHERSRVDSIIQSLHKKFDSRSECIYVLINYYIYGKQVDLTVIKQNSIIVIELKEFSSPFVATENGQWETIDGQGVVKSGNQPNPYQQVNNYRHAWSELIRDEFPDRLNITKGKNIDSIGLVCICPDLPKNTIVQIKYVSWFKLVGLDRLVDEIDYATSPSLSLNEPNIFQLIKRLNLRLIDDIVLDKQFIVPFAHNPNFVGREPEIEKLHGWLSPNSNNNSIVVITGMGGVGKTQLAIEYAQTFRVHYSDGIYWINGAIELTSQFAKLAELLELKVGGGSAENRERKLARAFVEKISNCRNALIIIDNYNDPKGLFSPREPFLFAHFKCRILVTSQKCDSNLPIYYLNLHPTAACDSMEILLRSDRHLHLLEIAKKDTNNDNPELIAARNICHQLGNLPLALALSAAYLGKYPEITLADYSLRLLEEGGLTLDNLNLDPTYLATQHSVIISTTLSMQWKSIRNLKARNFLRALSLFPENALVPIDFLSISLGYDEKAKRGYPSSLGIVKKELSDLSLLEFVDKDKLRLHPLIRAYVFEKIKDKKKF